MSRFGNSCIIYLIFSLLNMTSLMLFMCLELTNMIFLTPLEGHVISPIILHLLVCLCISLFHCCMSLLLSVLLSNRWDFWVSLSSVWGDSMPYSLQAPSEAQQAQPLWDSSSSATEEARGASESGWSRQKVRGSLIWKPSTPPYLPLWDSS